MKQSEDERTKTSICKKQLCLLLGLLMIVGSLFTVRMTVGAEALPARTETFSEVSEPSETSEPAESTTYPEPCTESADAIVARMYICAESKFSLMGHTWVYIENLTDHELTVGLYTLPPEEGVSIGTFGVTRSDGFGIYYNVESYIINTYGLKRMYCMSEDLTAAKLEKASKKILRSNFWDPIVVNCVAFSFSTWNTVSRRKLIPMVFPLFSRLQILFYKHDDSLEMFCPPQDKIYKQARNGSRAYLKDVSPGTISHGL